MINRRLLLVILLAIILRLWHISQTPPSLYWDEASLGYNAYSILKTAGDEHGTFLPLTNFAAFGDYKPPGYIYLTVPSIALFKLNEFSIRFTSALFGILTVALTYFLTRKLFRNEIAALVSAFFLAVSPWHIQMSRAAFEANVALFFSTLGIFLFIKFFEGKPYYILISLISFLIAMYTFTGQRLFIPFMLIILIVQFKKQIFENIKIVFFSFVIAAILFWPLFKFATQTIEGKLRFDEVTIFRDLKPIDDSIRFRSEDNFSLISNLLYNRRIFFAKEYLIHYFDAFDPGFLFISGDANPRLSIQHVGQLYYFDIILVLSGVYFLFSKKAQYRFLIVGWLLASPLGSATARETPHALRMIHILPTYQIIAAFGAYNLYNLVKYKKVLIWTFAVLFSALFAYYLHMYYSHWPKTYSGEWQYGYKQAVEVVSANYDSIDHVVVTNSLGRPYIYFLLYMQFDPNKYLQTADIEKDEFSFFNVHGFDKFKFTNDIEEIGSGKTLIVADSKKLPDDAKIIANINGPDGSGVFDIGVVTR